MAIAVQSQKLKKEEPEESKKWIALFSSGNQRHWHEPTTK
jgi:hypothetical protein